MPALNAIHFAGNPVLQGNRGGAALRKLILSVKTPSVLGRHSSKTLYALGLNGLRFDSNFLMKTKYVEYFDLVLAGKFTELQALTPYRPFKKFNTFRDNRNGLNCSLIFTAASIGHHDIVKWLAVEHGVDVNIPAANWSTALHEAVNLGNTSVVKVCYVVTCKMRPIIILQVLLEAGADVQIQDIQKLWPIDVARMRSGSPGDQWHQIAMMLGCVVLPFRNNTDKKL